MCHRKTCAFKQSVPTARGAAHLQTPQRRARAATLRPSAAKTVPRICSIIGAGNAAMPSPTMLTASRLPRDGPAPSTAGVVGGLSRERRPAACMTEVHRTLTACHGRGPACHPRDVRSRLLLLSDCDSPVSGETCVKTAECVPTQRQTAFTQHQASNATGACAGFTCRFGYATLASPDAHSNMHRARQQDIIGDA